MTLVNACSIRPDQLKPGDEMCFVIKAMVNWIDDDGKLRYRIYRCHWDGTENDIPQGAQVLDHEAMCKEFFPSLALVGIPG